MTHQAQLTAPQSFLPLTTPVFHILLSLVDEHRHGYGIILEVDRRTGNSVRIGTGTLYTAMRRLLASGLVEETSEGTVDEGEDDRRRYYSITPKGRAVVTAEATRLEGMVAMARGKHLLT